MGRDASVGPLDWADGQYTFRLAWGQLVELQEATDAGPFALLERLSTKNWRLQDISQTIRLSLIGGGTEPAKALSLVRSYVESRPPVENLMLARGILGIAVMGAPDEAPGEPKGEETVESSTTSPTASSGSA